MSMRSPQSLSFEAPVSVYLPPPPPPPPPPPHPPPTPTPPPQPSPPPPQPPPQPPHTRHDKQTHAHSQHGGVYESLRPRGRRPSPRLNARTVGHTRNTSGSGSSTPALATAGAGHGPTYRRCGLLPAGVKSLLTAACAWPSTTRQQNTDSTTDHRVNSGSLSQQQATNSSRVATDCIRTLVSSRVCSGTENTRTLDSSGGRRR